MESANSPNRCFGSRLHAKHAVWRIAPICLVLGIGSGQHLVRSLSDLQFVAVLCLVLSLWHFHMNSAGVNCWVALSAIALFSATLSVVPESFADLTSLAGGVFLYLLIWVLAEYDRQPALQGVATAALLLSGGILAKPAIAISCVVLSLVFFLAHMRFTAHPAGFGLLLFTPAALCATGAAIFAFLNARSLFAQAAFAALPNTAPLGAADWRYLFLFPAAVLAFRISRQCWCSADLAFLAMCALGSVICRGQWVDALQIRDLFFLSAAGAAALVSMSSTPPNAQAMSRLKSPSSGNR